MNQSDNMSMVPTTFVRPLANQHQFMTMHEYASPKYTIDYPTDEQQQL